MPIKTVYLVGHCGADAMALQLAIKAAADNAEDLQIRTAVHTDDYVLNASGETLLLINRQLGNVLRRKTGVELISELNSSDDPPRMMLISNYEDAQAEAEAAGAMPGFGKAEIHKPETKAKLQAALVPLESSRASSE